MDSEKQTATQDEMGCRWRSGFLWYKENDLFIFIKRGIQVLSMVLLHSIKSPVCTGRKTLLSCLYCQYKVGWVTHDLHPSHLENKLSPLVVPAIILETRHKLTNYNTQPQHFFLSTLTLESTTLSRLTSRVLPDRAPPADVILTSLLMSLWHHHWCHSAKNVWFLCLTPQLETGGSCITVGITLIMVFFQYVVNGENIL